MHKLVGKSAFSAKHANTALLLSLKETNRRYLKGKYQRGLSFRGYFFVSLFVCFVWLFLAKGFSEPRSLVYPKEK